jgi:hypothetical protein
VLAYSASITVLLGLLNPDDLSNLRQLFAGGSAKRHNTAVRTSVSQN